MTRPPPELSEETLAELERDCAAAQERERFGLLTTIHMRLPTVRALISAARELASQRDAFAELLLIHEVLMPHKREGESYLQAVERLEKRCEEWQEHSIMTDEECERLDGLVQENEKLKAELTELKGAVEAKREVAVRLAETGLSLLRMATSAMSSNDSWCDDADGFELLADSYLRNGGSRGKDDR